MSPRPYKSPRRIAAATQTRQRIVAAAATILGTAEGIRGFSLQAVAKKADVTRLTVYNQFGSRRALLEAVFDERAARGGLHRVAEVMAGSDPQAGLMQVIVIFCDFWSFDPDTLGLLHAAGASDPEFGASVRERNERRRSLLSVLVRRIAQDRKLRPKVLGDLIATLRPDQFSIFFTVDCGSADRRCGLPPDPGARDGCCAAGDQTSDALISAG